MTDHNRPVKWGLVILSLVAGLMFCWPPKDRLKLGIDLAGGTSLLYEIDTTGLHESEITGLSTRVMEILKDRVDPNATMNLVWRPVGNTRLEIQMPMAGKESRDRRQAKETAFTQIRERNVRRYDIETALSAPVERTDSELAALTRGVASRTPLFVELRKAATARLAAPEDLAARDAYEKAIDNVLSTNLEEGKVRDVLELTFRKDQARERELARLKQEHAGYEDLIAAAAMAYDEWAKSKSDLEDPSDLKRRLKGAGVLEFRILADRDLQSPSFTTSQDPALRQRIDGYVESLNKRGPRVRTGDVYQWVPVKDIVDFENLAGRMTEDQFDAIRGREQQIFEKYAGQWYVLVHNDERYGLTRRAERPWKLEQAFPNIDSSTGQNVVSFLLDPVGGDYFAELTGSNVGRQLCVVLDGFSMSHATINERIGQSGQISGRFTQEKVNELTRTLEAGALPGRLKETPISEKTVGPTLGQHNLDIALNASKYGFVVLLIVVVIYYGLTAGLIADTALLLNLILLLASMSFLQATFTLPGIAGVALTLGMAIDANVLIFERIREERDRGVPLKKAIALGYEKAFSSIIDGNVTTLITCVVLGWVGSEEVKGFAITLGIGLVISLYTALFVTRLIFDTLVSQGWIKDLSMRRLLAKPNIDWMSKRKSFFTFSLVTTLAGLAAFVMMSVKGREALYDIEFLGGSSVRAQFLPTVEVTDEDVRRMVSSSNPSEPSAANWLEKAADNLADATLHPGEDAGTFVIESGTDQLNGEQIRALMQAQTEPVCERATASGQAAIFRVKAGVEMTPDQFAELRGQTVQYIRTRAVPNMRSARVQLSTEVSAEGGATSKLYEIVSVDTNLQLVQTALLAVLGDKLSVDEVVSYRLVQDPNQTQDNFFIIREDDRYLSDVIGGDWSYDVNRYKGGVAIQIEQLDPPLTHEEFDKRLREVQMQAEYQNFQGREHMPIGLSEPIARADGKQAYTKFVVLAVDDGLPYSEDNADSWKNLVAGSELKLVETALGSSRTFPSVMQFAPQVAQAATQNAMVAIVLALGAILVYVWVRFDSFEFGAASIVATFHDVAFTLGALTLAHLLAGTFIGRALGILPFKIDLAMVAALLTIIGYSLNDTVVVFDRIRENRGRGTINAGMINNAINETLSRTVLTGGTTLIMIGFLYTMAGEGVRGFCYAFLIGVLIGTYSSIAVASPLLYRADKLFIVSKCIVGAVASGMVLAYFGSGTGSFVALAVVIAGTGYWIIRGRQAGGYRTAAA